MAEFGEAALMRHNVAALQIRVGRHHRFDGWLRAPFVALDAVGEHRRGKAIESLKWQTFIAEQVPPVTAPA